jgi:hypothetical protein
VACTLYSPTHKISYVPVGSFISPGNAPLGPESSPAPGYFGAVSGGIQAAPRGLFDPRKPDVASGAFYPHFEELKSCSCWQLHQPLEPQVRFLGLWLAFPGVILLEQGS